MMSDDENILIAPRPRPPAGDAEVAQQPHAKAVRRRFIEKWCREVENAHQSPWLARGRRRDPSSGRQLG
jgi:hypothetical protein